MTGPDHVVMGAGYQMAQCQNCGGTMPTPIPPLTLDELLRQLRRFMERHAGCPE